MRREKSTGALLLVGIFLFIPAGTWGADLTKVYDPSLGTYPNQQGFSVTQIPEQEHPFDCSTSGGVMEMDYVRDSFGTRQPTYYRSFYFGGKTFSFDDGVTIEIDLEVLDSTYNAYPNMYRAGFSVGVADSQNRLIQIYISNYNCWLQNKVNMKYGIDFEQIVFLDTRRKLKLEIDGSGASLYLVENDIPSLASTIEFASSSQTSLASEIWFGDCTAFGESDVKIYDFRFTIGCSGDDCDDCNSNGVPDLTDISGGTSFDCNGNLVPDECDIAEDPSLDCNDNGILDECDGDCNRNGIADDCETAGGTAPDCNNNYIPDECDMANDGIGDCNTNGIPDDCDIAEGTSDDLNSNGIPDECEALAQPGDFVNIEGGDYLMGCDTSVHEPWGVCSHWRQHPVHIDSFEMGVFEITNQEYCDYLNDVFDDVGSGGFASDAINVDLGTHHDYVCASTDAQDGTCDIIYAYIADPDCVPSIYSFSHIKWRRTEKVFMVDAGFEFKPVVNVSWYGAASYANWLSEGQGLTAAYTAGSGLYDWECDYNVDGYRLPTEAEWEYAARGSDYNPYYDYPWSSNSIDDCSANYNDSADPFDTPGITGDISTTPVGYYDGNQVIDDTCASYDMANNYGLYDMAGNVWEWCNDWWKEENYFDPDLSVVACNPTGPAERDTYTNKAQVMRGGGWTSDPAYEHLMVWYRASIYFTSVEIPAYLSNVVGFRLCKRTVFPSDCNSNGVSDVCDIGGGTSLDCNSNGIPDECDIAGGTSVDTNTNGIPDECEAAPPAMTAALSLKGHGSIPQTFYGIAADGVECRSGGITSLKFTFDKIAYSVDGNDFVANDFTLSRGTIQSISTTWDNQFRPPIAQIVLTISGVTTTGQLTVQFSGENSDGIETEYEACWTYILADVNGDGAVNDGDEAYLIAAHQGELSTKFWCDLDLDGEIEAGTKKHDDLDIWDATTPVSAQSLCSE